MIAILLHTYASLLITIAASALFLLGLGIYGILRYNRPHEMSLKKVQKQPMAQVLPAGAKSKTLTAKQLLQDLTAIAGEDVLLTQLDLARAYIDSGKKELAKNIINNVLAQGGASYKQEARQLLNCI